MKKKLIKIPFVKYFKLLTKYLRPHKSRLILLIVLITSSTILAVLNPKILKHYIDSVLNPDFQNLSDLKFAILIYMGIAFLAQTLTIISVYVGFNLAWDTTNKLRYDLLTHSLNLDMNFHNSKKPGEMIEMIDGDVLNLSTFFPRVLFLQTLALLDRRLRSGI